MKKKRKYKLTAEIAEDAEFLEWGSPRTVGFIIRWFGGYHEKNMKEKKKNPINPHRCHYTSAIITTQSFL